MGRPAAGLRADDIGAIFWEPATGKVIGRYRGFANPRSGDVDSFPLRDRAQSCIISLETRKARALPGASGDDRKVKLRDLDELRRLLAEIELGW